MVAKFEFVYKGFVVSMGFFLIVVFFFSFRVVVEGKGKWLLKKEVVGLVSCGYVCFEDLWEFGAYIYIRLEI